MSKEPERLRNARYTWYATAGELFSARSRNIDITPYVEARDEARKAFVDEYVKVYGEEPHQDDYIQMEFEI